MNIEPGKSHSNKEGAVAEEIAVVEEIVDGSNCLNSLVDGMDISEQKKSFVLLTEKVTQHLKNLTHGQIYGFNLIIGLIDK